MPNKNALSSSLLMLSASWLSKGLGLISTVILARILSPEDFGLVAIAMLIIYFFDIFSQTGTKQYLLSKDNITTEDLDTAWTLNVITKSIIGLVIFFSANFMASFFNSDIQLTLIVCSIIPVIIGLESPAINLVKRAFNYQGIFKLQLAAKFLGFITTITIALETHSHWAMIFGTIIYFSTLSIGSYIVASYKPSFSLNNVANQWNYSKWILYRGFIGYARAKGDAFLLAKFFSVGEVGVFSIAKELAMLVYEQIAMPIGEIIMTSIQKVKDDQKQIKVIMTKYIIILVAALLPIICLFSLLSESIILFFLGDKWLDAAPIFSILTILGVTSSITIVFTSTMNALKKTKQAFKIDLISTIIILTTLYLYNNSTIIEFSFIRAMLGFVVLFAYISASRKFIQFKFIELLSNLLPIITSFIAMFIAVVWLKDFIRIESNFLYLCINSILGLFIYACTLSILIYISPQKNGQLRNIVDPIKQKIKRSCM
jgi:O-antigen/teichoic acid export membrane protein